MGIVIVHLGVRTLFIQVISGQREGWTVGTCGGGRHLSHSLSGRILEDEAWCCQGKALEGPQGSPLGKHVLGSKGG